MTRLTKITFKDYEEPDCFKQNSDGTFGRGFLTPVPVHQPSNSANLYLYGTPITTTSVFYDEWNHTLENPITLQGGQIFSASFSYIVNMLRFANGSSNEVSPSGDTLTPDEISEWYDWEDNQISSLEEAREALHLDEMEMFDEKEYTKTDA